MHLTPALVGNAHDPNTTASDADIVSTVRGGDTAQFALLVQRHNQRLFRLGIAYLRRPELVEDAMQNTYLHAFTHLAGFNGRSTFSTWICRIMINECLMHLRRARRQEHASHAAGSDPLRPAMDEGHAARTLAASEAQALLEQAVAALPEAYRVVYILRDIQHSSTDETAALLDLSPDNVRVRLHRAREMLKTHLLASAAGRELFRYPASQCEPFTARVMSEVRSLARMSGSMG